MIFKFYRFLSALALMLLAGCGKQTGSATADLNVDYYTCDMHPSVHSHDPKAKCPICSMDLEPVYKKGAKPGGSSGASQSAASSQPHEFTVPVERQQQIGVTFAEARKMPLQRIIRAAGTVASDMTRSWEYAARVDGYVQKLNVTSPGEAVKRDQALLSIYSPDLLISERELVSQFNARDHESSVEAKTHHASLIEASRRRLEQWNVTAQQIDELEKSRQPSEFLTLRSPFDGVVEDVPVQQGRRVMPGDRLVKVVDLSLVWVWAEFYEDELQQLSRGEKVTVTSPSYPGEHFDGEIALVSPFVAEMKRTLKARLDIPNPNFKLRPGMYVNVELALHKGPALAIPVSAIMPTGAQTLVFLDKGGGKLEPRPIRIGGQYGDFYQVLAGLNEGERVVSSANFLIDAESKVQGAVKSFEEPAKQEGQP